VVVGWLDFAAEAVPSCEQQNGILVSFGDEEFSFFTMSKSLVACYGLPRPQGGASVDGAHPDNPVARLPEGLYDVVTVMSASGALTDVAKLGEAAKRAKAGGSVEVREVVWAWPSAEGRPPAAVAPALQSLRAARVGDIRTAESLRRAVVYAGLSPSGTSVRPLAAPELRAAAEAAYPALASQAAAGAAEAHDALTALAAALAPHLALGVVVAQRPAYSPGVSFSLRSRGALPKTAPPAAPPSATPPPAAPAPLAAGPPAASGPDDSALKAWSAAAASAAAGDAGAYVDEAHLT